MNKILLLICSVTISGCGLYAQQQNLAALESIPVGTQKEELASKLSSPLGSKSCTKIGMIDGEIIESCPYTITLEARALWDNNIFFHKGEYVGKGNKTTFLRQYQNNYSGDSGRGTVLVVRTYGVKEKSDNLWTIPKGSALSVNLFSDGQLVGELFHDGAVLLDHNAGEIQLTLEQKGTTISDTKLQIEKDTNYILYFDYLSGSLRLDGDDSSKIQITSNPPGAWVFAGSEHGKLSNIGKKTPFALNRKANSTHWANEYYQVKLEGFEQSKVVFRDNSFGDRKIDFDLKEAELTGLDKIEFEFNQELSSYENLKKQHNSRKIEYDEKEISFLNELNNEQLEAYSFYTDAYNNNEANIAKVILSFRKFSSTLDEKKKNKFVALYSEKKTIEKDSDLLEKMGENLNERKNSIASIKEEIVEANKKALEKQRRAREGEIRKHQQLVAAQNAQAVQSAQNSLNMLTVFTAGINAFSSVQTQKYNARAQAYRNYSDQYESDRRNRELVNSIKGIEDSITRTRRGLW